MQGMADVLASGQGEHQLNKMQERSRRLGAAQSRLARVNGLQASAGRLLADIGMIGMLWLGAEQVRMGNLDGVLLGALMLLAFSSFEAFLPLPQAAQHLSNSLAAAGRLFEIADAQPGVREPANPAPIPADLNIEVTDLSFGYPEPGRQTGEETLSHISFSLTPGKKIALVGTSGAGKSTLFNLLLRFWDGEEGKIQLDQIAYQRYSGDGLRKHMAVLPQNPALFSASIWDNLRLAQPKASREEIEQAAQRAGLHEWIASLPNGYQTWVGEAGIKLSGGQRQRMALARTLLRKAPLYLLDEPTSQLDLNTERAALQGILETVQENQAALLLITHRLVGLEQMDEILVLKDGRIVQRGRHAELRTKDGTYQKMCELQEQG
jgi:ATP-binding cassette subfamily C protein CydC